MADRKFQYGYKKTYFNRSLDCALFLYNHELKHNFFCGNNIYNPECCKQKPGSYFLVAFAALHRKFSVNNIFKFFLLFQTFLDFLHMSFRLLEENY